MINGSYKIINWKVAELFISADGIALGAAATTSQTHVEMIVFVAIMLHKVYYYRSFLIMVKITLAENRIDLLIHFCYRRLPHLV